ncbi:MAG: Eco57I restriction-modification methylase domain-containing protein, partial [Flavisolibacter sp.]
MPVLTTQQRNTLESAVKLARKLAETGARNALQALAVNNPEPFAHMSPEQRTLRNRLRNKARLLGDELPATGHQQIDHLSYELAYENWHKMLFAKFLEANGLLMHTSGVAVTMEECEELAKEESFTDKWEAAASYASKMLPAIFRPEDPVMQVHFASNDRIKLEEVLDGLDNYIFTADDALGWVYQFWQSEAKKAINDSQAKIDGAKLPAVTQLFTEPYMVHFLIDNTIGAWWVSHHPAETPPVKFEYLRLLENGTPAAGNFEGWPNTTKEIMSLDPCMGSGHFIASLFPVFAKLRMYEEGLSKEEATDKVIKENLHGLELDARCTQIAAFNLALTAWKFIGSYKELAEMNLACSGIAPTGKREDWVKLVGKVTDPAQKARMENGMKVLYDHFQLAPELGSLLDPSTIKPDMYTASFEELKPVLKKAFENEADNEFLERGVMAAGIAKAGLLLAKKYTITITNVPYLARGKQDDMLADYSLNYYPDAKGDLATVFLDRLIKTTSSGGVVCNVIPQNWLFLTTYKKFREKLLKNHSWNIVSRLGSGAFSQISGEVVKAILVCITLKRPDENHSLLGIDVSNEVDVATKDSQLKICDFSTLNQQNQLKNPDSRIVIGTENTEILLEKFAKGIAGIQTGDFPQFGRGFWEIKITKDWEYESSTVESTTYYGGKHYCLFWENFEGVLARRQKNGESYVRGWQAFGKKGILVSAMSKLPVSIYNGEFFDNNTAVILPNNVDELPAIWSFCSSNMFNEEVRKIDQKINVTNATLVKIPFDLEYWKTVAKEKFPNGLPKPYSNDATQWLFHGHPMKADNPLQVAVARLLGYFWPAENDAEMELADEASELIKQIKTFDDLADADGILCIPPVNGELAASERLRSYLQTVYGSA